MLAVIAWGVLTGRLAAATAVVPVPVPVCVVAAVRWVRGVVERASLEVARATRGLPALFAVTLVVGPCLCARCVCPGPFLCL